VVNLDRKRKADRARRARIKAGEWDFPNGGAVEFARAGSRRAPRAAVSSDSVSPRARMVSVEISGRAASQLSARAAPCTARGPIRAEPLSTQERPATEGGAVRYPPVASKVLCEYSCTGNPRRCARVNGRDRRKAWAWACSAGLRLSRAAGSCRHLDLHQMAHQHRNHASRSRRQIRRARAPDHSARNRRRRPQCQRARGSPVFCWTVSVRRSPLIRRSR
jgi:hypothetical protein